MPEIFHHQVVGACYTWGVMNGYKADFEDKTYEKLTTRPHRPDLCLTLRDKHQNVSSRIYVEAQTVVDDDYRAKCAAQYGKEVYAIIDLKQIGGIRMDGTLVNSSAALYWQIDAILSKAAERPFRSTVVDKVKTNNWCWKCKAEVPDGESLMKHWKREHQKMADGG